MKSFSIETIRDLVDGVLVGNTSNQIVGPEQIERAGINHITFVGNRKYVRLWDESKASVAVVNENLKIEPGVDRALIRVKNADLAMAQILELFSPDLPHFEVDIHPAAVVHESVQLGEGTRVGAGCYVGKNVRLGAGVTLYPNVTVLDECTIGDGSVIWSGTVVRERCHIGRHCILHSNVTIGADGFGYRPHPEGKGLVKIPHIGNVILGDAVEIGANSCVDRAKFSSTILGDGCKIDNLVQIAHNCVLGRSCIMAGASGLAGSVTLGDGVVIAGSSSIKDHTTIGSGAVVGAGSGVMADVAAGKKVLGYPAVEYRDALKQWVALRKLAKEND
jgi:UDP-3-O-[3-hydroxymyristoyl] glucosamine N-acyltransferase